MGPILKSVQYKWLALHLHRDISHTDITTFYQLQRGLGGGGGGGGGNVIITEIYLSQSRFQPLLHVRHWFVRINAGCGIPNDE